MQNRSVDVAGYLARDDRARNCACELELPMNLVMSLKVQICIVRHRIVIHRAPRSFIEITCHSLVANPSYYRISRADIALQLGFGVKNKTFVQRRLNVFDVGPALYNSFVFTGKGTDRGFWQIVITINRRKDQ